MSAVERAAAMLGVRARRDVPLGPLTTYRVGGPAALFLEAADEADLERARAAVSETGLPVLVVGRGSNLLVADRGFPGLAVVLGEGFAGIELEGTEVKALRNGGAQLKDGYVLVRDGELFLHNVHIPPYAPAAHDNHEPERDRRLLAHRRQIDRLAAQLSEKGLTLVPTRIYFSGGRAKVEIALARGKDRFDKREAIKERETKRDMERALREVNR